jgi:hypothetical protein
MSLKVIIYSSKEIYDTAGYEGRAEADLVAYRIEDEQYYVVKCSFDSMFLHPRTGPIATYYVKRAIERKERDMWNDELAAYKAA